MVKLNSLIDAAFRPPELKFLRSHPEFIKAMENAADNSRPAEHFVKICKLGHELLLKHDREDDPKRRPHR